MNTQQFTLFLLPFVIIIVIGTFFRSTKLISNSTGSKVEYTKVNNNNGILRRSNIGAIGIPEGEGQALPSIRITEEETKLIKRDNYGGAGDKKHLGGFTDIDVAGLTPTLWKDMVTYMGIHSIMDVGCGRGISTSWFLTHGLDVHCVEGSHDAVEKSIVPNKEDVYTEHDFSRGPWWPKKTYDAVWCVEFLEHVGRNFMHNYIPVFQKAAILIVTSSRVGGWHHVEVHDDDWWILKLSSYGFQYSEFLTKRIRDMAVKDRNTKAPNGGLISGQHLWMTGKVFLNPSVASLPEHQHLFAEHGCYKERKNGKIYQKPCTEDKSIGAESLVPKNFLPLNLTKEMDEEWEELVRANTQPVIKKK